MLFVDFKNNRFEIRIKTSDPDEFSDHISFFKLLFLTFDYPAKVYHFKVNRFLELKLLFEKKGWEVKYTDQCLTVYDEYFKSFKPSIKYNRNTELDYSILNEGVKLFDFQKQGIEFILSRTRCGEADDAGLGKTIEAVFAFSQLYKQGKIKGIFIIVKTGLSYQWKKSILDFVNVFKEDDIVIINNDNKKQIFDNYKDKKIIIVPSHLTAHIFLSYKKDQKLNESAKKVRWKDYVDINKVWNDNLMLVVDESHTFNNSSGVWTRALLAHTKFFDYRIAMSATPTGNYFERYYNAMQIIDEKALPYSEKAFKLYLAKETDDRYSPYDIKTYDVEHVNEIKKTLSLYFIKRLKSELPEMKHKQIIKPIYVEMSNQHKRLYQEFLQNAVSVLERDKGRITVKTIINKLPYLIQILDNPLLMKGRVENESVDALINKWKEENDNKLNLLKNLLESYVDEQNEKVVLLDNHPFTINLLANKFAKYNPLILHGQMGYDDQKKQEIQDIFNDINNKHRLLIGNPQVMGVGTNFNKGARRIIFNTCPNDAVLTAQSLDRCYRINNTRDAVVEFLLYDHSLDILRYKRNMGRLELNNDFLTKNLNKSELKNLLEMVG